MDEKTRVLVVDDQEVVRDAIRVALGQHEDIEIAGEASDGGDLVNRVEELHPDVVLLDLRMPDVDGITALAALHESHPETKVVTLTILSERECVRESFNLGAVGYAVKGEGEGRLADIVRQVSGGAIYVHPLVHRPLLQQLRNAGTDRLTSGEKELLDLLAEGLPDDAIAGRLEVDTVQAERQIAELLDKLDFVEPVQQLAARLRSELLAG